MKKKLLIFLTLFLFTPFVVRAYDINMDWQKSFGGNDRDSLYNVIETKDGGFIAAGFTESSNIMDFPMENEDNAVIVKFDKTGNIIWKNVLVGNESEEFLNILETTNGEIIVCGSSESTDIADLPNKGMQDSVLVKYDKDGNMLWQKSWGGNGNDEPFNIFETEDDGLITIMFSYSTNLEGLSNKGNSDIVIVKYDKDGEILWQKSWGGNGYDEPNSIINMPGDEFIIEIFSKSTDLKGLENKGSSDAILVKFDKDGNVLWQTSWGGNEEEDLNHMIKTHDDGIVVAGYSYSTDIEYLANKGENDAIIVKYDKNGNILWQNSFGGNEYEKFESIIETNDNGIVLICSSDSTDIDGIPNKGQQDVIIIKYDKDGELEWQRNWGGNASEYFYYLLETEEGGIVITGSSESTDIADLPNKGREDSVLVKYDKDGNMLWQKSFGGNKYDETYYMLETEDGGFITLVYSTSTDIKGLSNNGGSDLVIVKYSFEYNLEDNTKENGTSIIKQNGKYGVITPSPNDGYEVDQIIIKDLEGNFLNVNVVANNDGTYSFPLYEDVSVEVLFKEKIENPKTGILDVITIIFVGLFISLSGFFIVKRYNERLEF